MHISFIVILLEISSNGFRRVMDRINSEKPAPAALERHYTCADIAELWSLSKSTVRKIFENEAGVLTWGREETSRGRGYRSMRIPECVLVRVHERMRAGA
jgi:hypothetical protein